MKWHLRGAVTQQPTEQSRDGETHQGPRVYRKHGICSQHARSVSRPGPATTTRPHGRAGDGRLCSTVRCLGSDALQVAGGWPRTQACGWCTGVELLSESPSCPCRKKRACLSQAARGTIRRQTRRGNPGTHQGVEKSWCTLVPAMEPHVGCTMSTEPRAAVSSLHPPYGCVKRPRLHGQGKRGGLSATKEGTPSNAAGLGGVGMFVFSRTHPPPTLAVLAASPLHSWVSFCLALLFFGFGGFSHQPRLGHRRRSVCRPSTFGFTLPQNASQAPR